MEDIPMLAEHFLQMYEVKYKKDGVSFAQSSYDQMLNYHWRGNVRELQNVIERAVLLSRDSKIEQLNLPNSEGGSFQEASAAGMAAPVAAGTYSGSAMSFSKPAAQTIEIETGEELFDSIGKMIVDSLDEKDEGTEGPDVFENIEGGIVKAALKRTRGNKQAAANLLGVYRPRLYGMIKRHAISEDD
jgi:DNA-binding NtrC family response regulator